MGDDVVTGGEKAEPVEAKQEQNGNGSSGAPVRSGSEQESADSLESAQREARERLASIAAAMAERSKQPMRKSDSIGGTLTLEEIEAMERPQTKVEEPPDPASIVPPPDPPTLQMQQSQRQPAATMTSSQTHNLPMSAMQSIKTGKRIDKKTVAILATGALVAAGIGAWAGAHFRTEHTVIYGLAPAKDGGFGKGKTLPLTATGENPVADIVAEVMPTVVNIDIAPPMPATSTDAGSSASPFSFNSGHSRRLELGRPERTMGSGIIIRSDGYVITMAHVIRTMGNRIVVTLSDKRSFDAKVVGRDSFTDLALLKIDADNLPVARFGTSANLRPGDWAIAVGSPLGYDHTVTLGIISAVGRSLADLNSHVDLIQTDAAINQGNSGGPLLNIHGEVVGVNDAVRSGAQNISFAVPVDVVRSIADELLAHGSIKRPYVGIFMDDLDHYMAERMNSASTRGVIVTHVLPGGPCEKAGVGQGDIILSVDGHKVETAKEFRDILKDCTPGEVIEFVLSRKGSEEKRKVVVGNYPEE
jgi:S1-C subfamily serine protease